MVWPGRSLVMLAVIVGAVLLGTGLFELWTVVRTRDADAGQRAVAVVNGLLLLVVGIFCVRQPGLSAVTLTLSWGSPASPPCGGGWRRSARRRCSRTRR
jgi:uncharacterized membrane protein HdeD (DUF308 family)